MAKPFVFDETLFPNGISSGDVTQTSAVLWTRATTPGLLTFEIATDKHFKNIVSSGTVMVADSTVPVKKTMTGLDPDQQYYYRAVDADGHVITGSFETAAELGTHTGFSFAVAADHHVDLAPFVAIKNLADANVDLVIKLGDTVYADLPNIPPGLASASTLEEFRAEHDAVYSSHLGINYWAEIQATKPILSMIDDHEVTNDFAGGADPISDPRFDQTGNFINETTLYANGLQAFNEYNAIETLTYNGTGDDLFDGAPNLYRYNTYGSDAAIIMVDARSFRDIEAPAPTNPVDFGQIALFLQASFDPTRTMLGEEQLNQLKQDLLDAQSKDVLWKFVMLPEPIQNFGPVIAAGDRYEGYAAERNALLKFIDENHIENVVFVSSDTHFTSVNNLTYQTGPLGPLGPQIASSAIEVNTLATAALSIASLIPLGAFQAGLISAAELAFYNSLPNAPDTDSIANDKDDFVKGILNGYMTQPFFGYDPIGLDSNQASLLQGDYFVGHSFGWTEFNVDAHTGKLLVTTWGIPTYTDPSAALSSEPTIVSQFEVTPQTIGAAQPDTMNGTSDGDVILGAEGNDVLNGRSGDDYLDGGKDQDVIFGGPGNDHIFGRDGNDELNGQGGDDEIDGGAGQDDLNGDDGNDTLIGGLDADTLNGGKGVDTLIGGPGNDTLDGGKGNDTLDGGAGNDMLTGGAGNDSFRFATALSSATNVDQITDFVVADDTIQLENAVFTALPPTGTLPDGNFAVGAAADADDFIIYDDTTGGLFYDSDGNAAGAQVQFATLDAGLAMTNNDFLLV